MDPALKAVVDNQKAEFVALAKLVPQLIDGNDDYNEDCRVNGEQYGHFDLPEDFSRVFKRGIFRELKKFFIDRGYGPHVKEAIEKLNAE